MALPNYQHPRPKHSMDADTTLPTPSERVQQTKRQRFEEKSNESAMSYAHVLSGATLKVAIVLAD